MKARLKFSLTDTQKHISQEWSRVNRLLFSQFFQWQPFAQKILNDISTRCEVWWFHNFFLQVVFSIDGSFAASVSVTGKDPKVKPGAVDIVRHWQELGYLLVYVTGRPDMQLQRVVAWLTQHNFPKGLVSFADGFTTDPLKYVFQLVGPRIWMMPCEFFMARKCFIRNFLSVPYARHYNPRFV